MKEYLFRGKSMETSLKIKVQKGDWIYGSLITDRSTGSKRYLIYVNPKKIIRVNPKTLGMYTGVKDCNKKKLFVGDIVDVQRQKYNWFVNPFEIVLKNDLIGFTMIHANRDGDDFGVFTSSLTQQDKEYTLIGNIFDNPTKKK